MITARYIPSLNEIRLYKPDGMYWPIKLKKFLDEEEIEGFVKFVVDNWQQSDV